MAIAQSTYATDTGGELAALRLLLDRVELEVLLVQADALHANPGLIQSVSQVLWPELPAWGLLGGIASSLCPTPTLPQLILI